MKWIKCGNESGSFFRTMGNPPGQKEWCCYHHKDLSEIDLNQPEPNWVKRVSSGKRMPLGSGRVLSFDKDEE